MAFALVVVLPSQILRAYKGTITTNTDPNLRAIALGLVDYEVVKKEVQLKPENPLTYFEIPVTDLERAIRFYETVFDCKLERSTIDGNEWRYSRERRVHLGASVRSQRGRRTSRPWMVHESTFTPMISTGPCRLS